MPRLAAPRVVFFDWHGTLADTFEAMYNALDDLLPNLAALGLAQRFVPPGRSRLPEHEALLAQVRAAWRVPQEVRRSRRISRTEIFEILFGPDEDAKHAAHEAYDECYARHFDEVRPFEAGVTTMLGGLRAAGLRIGMLTNRRRELFSRELSTVEGSGWNGLFDIVVCGNDVRRRKPATDMVRRALEGIGAAAGADVWMVGDSTTDIVAAKDAGITAVYYNGARWGPQDLVRIFPGSHRPDAIAGNFAALLALALPLRRSMR